MDNEIIVVGFSLLAILQSRMKENLGLACVQLRHEVKLIFI
jgi:hypothetical protein